MRPNFQRFAVVMGISLSILAFQNCSKLGTGGISVQEMGAIGDGQMLDLSLPAEGNGMPDGSVGSQDGDAGAGNPSQSNQPNQSDVGSDSSQGEQSTSSGSSQSTQDGGGMTSSNGGRSNGGSIPAGSIPTLPNSQQVPDDYSIAYSGVCSDFAGMQMPIPETQATNDYEQAASSGLVQIGHVRDVNIGVVSGKLTVESARDVFIGGKSGSAVIKSAQSAIIYGSGELKVSANVIPEIAHAGKLCINAVSIGKIIGISGGTKIIAKEIEEIGGFSGNIHIYGAVVKSIGAASGRICLHDGAQILSMGVFSGYVGDCKNDGLNIEKTLSTQRVR